MPALTAATASVRTSAGHRPVARQPRHRLRQRQVARRDRRRPRSAVRLQDVAVDQDRALAHLLQRGHRAQRPADQPLDLLGPSRRPAALHLAGRPHGRRPRQHRVLGGDPARAGALQPPRRLRLVRRASPARGSSPSPAGRSPPPTRGSPSRPSPAAGPAGPRPSTRCFVTRSPPFPPPPPRCPHGTRAAARSAARSRSTRRCESTSLPASAPAACSPASTADRWSVSAPSRAASVASATSTSAPDASATSDSVGAVSALYADRRPARLDAHAERRDVVAHQRGAHGERPGMERLPRLDLVDVEHGRDALLRLGRQQVERPVQQPRRREHRRRRLVGRAEPPRVEEGIQVQEVIEVRVRRAPARPRRRSPPCRCRLASVPVPASTHSAKPSCRTR